MTRSLRLRLLLGSTLVISVTLGVLSAATIMLMRRTLIADFDSASLAKAKALSAAIEQHERNVIVEVGEIDPDHVHLPGIYVDRIVHNQNPEKRIEQRTVRAGDK